MGYSFWRGEGDHFCGYDFDSQTCDWTNYFLRLALQFAAPGLIFATLACIVGIPLLILYCLFRRCCKARSNRKWILLTWCNPQRITKREWTRKQKCFFENGLPFRIAYVTIVVITTLVVLATFGLDLSVNVATLQFKIDSKNFCDDKIDSIQGTISNLQTLQLDADLGEYTTPVYDQVNSVLKTFKDTVNTVDGYASNIVITKFTSESMMMLGWIMACVAGIMGVIMVKRNLALCMQTCSFIMLIVFLSGFFSFCMLSQALFDDICVDNDISIENGNSAIKNGVLPCNSSDILDSKAQLDQAVDDAVNQTCATVAEGCGNSSYGYINCGNYTCNISTIPAAPDSIIVTDFLICGDASCPPSACALLNQTFCYQANYTLRDCVSQCINNDTIQYANETVIAADDGAVFIDAFQNVLEPMLDCEFVGEYASYIKEPLCTGMMRVQWVALCLIFAGLGFISCMFLAMLIQNSVLDHDDVLACDFPPQKQVPVSISTNDGRSPAGAFFVAPTVLSNLNT